MNTLPKGLILFLATTVAGFSAIVVAGIMGKDWHGHEIVYDLGIAVLTVALVELLLVRVLRELAERRSEIEQLHADLEKSDERHRQQMQAFDQSMRDIKLDNVFSTLHKMDQLLTIKLDEIQGTVSALKHQQPQEAQPKATPSGTQSTP